MARVRSSFRRLPRFRYVRLSSYVLAWRNKSRLYPNWDYWQMCCHVSDKQVQGFRMLVRLSRLKKKGGLSENI